MILNIQKLSYRLREHTVVLLPAKCECEIPYLCYLILKFCNNALQITPAMKMGAVAGETDTAYEVALSEVSLCNYFIQDEN